jgi:hypothetical protein
MSKAASNPFDSFSSFAWNDFDRIQALIRNGTPVTGAHLKSVAKEYTSVSTFLLLAKSSETVPEDVLDSINHPRLVTLEVATFLVEKGATISATFLQRMLKETYKDNAITYLARKFLETAETFPAHLLDDCDLWFLSGETILLLIQNGAKITEAHLQKALNSSTQSTVLEMIVHACDTVPAELLDHVTYWSRITPALLATLETKGAKITEAHLQKALIGNAQNTVLVMIASACDTVPAELLDHVPSWYNITPALLATLETRGTKIKEVHLLKAINGGAQGTVLEMILHVCDTVPVELLDHVTDWYIITPQLISTLLAKKIILTQDHLLKALAKNVNGEVHYLIASQCDNLSDNILDQLADWRYLTVEVLEIMLTQHVVLKKEYVHKAMTDENIIVASFLVDYFPSIPADFLNSLIKTTLSTSFLSTLLAKGAVLDPSHFPQAIEKENPKTIGAVLYHLLHSDTELDISTYLPYLPKLLHSWKSVGPQPDEGFFEVLSHMHDVLPGKAAATQMVDYFHKHFAQGNFEMARRIHEVVTSWESKNALDYHFPFQPPLALFEASLQQGLSASVERSLPLALLNLCQKAGIAFSNEAKAWVHSTHLMEASAALDFVHLHLGDLAQHYLLKAAPLTGAMSFDAYYKALGPAMKALDKDIALEMLAIHNAPIQTFAQKTISFRGFNVPDRFSDADIEGLFAYGTRAAGSRNMEQKNYSFGLRKDEERTSQHWEMGGTYSSISAAMAATFSQGLTVAFTGNAILLEIVHYPGDLQLCGKNKYEQELVGTYLDKIVALYTLDAANQVRMVHHNPGLLDQQPSYALGEKIVDKVNAKAAYDALACQYMPELLTYSRIAVTSYAEASIASFFEDFAYPYPEDLCMNLSIK